MDLRIAESHGGHLDPGTSEARQTSLLCFELVALLGIGIEAARCIYRVRDGIIGVGTKPWVSGLVLVISMGLSPAVAAVRCRRVDSLEAAIAVCKVLLSCGHVWIWIDAASLWARACGLFVVMVSSWTAQ